MFSKQKPVTFASDQSKIHFAKGLLQGQALARAEAVNAIDPSGFTSYDDLLEKL